MISLREQSVRIFRIFADDGRSYLEAHWTRANAVRAFESQHADMWAIRCIDITEGE